MLRIDFSDNRQPGVWLVVDHFTLGRAPTNSLPISDPGVSPVHAEIHESEGYYYLSDCASENGTFVNEQRIKSHYQLRHEDRIRLGSVELMLVDSIKAKLRSEAPPPRWSLQVLKGEHEGKRFHVAGSMTFGRSTKCELCFADMELSRRHCEFFLTNDMLEIKDLASANGVFVNQRKVDTALLQAGDQLTMGSVSLLVVGPKVELTQGVQEDATVFIRAVKSSPKKHAKHPTPALNPLRAEARAKVTALHPELTPEVVPEAPAPATSGRVWAVVLGLGMVVAAGVVMQQLL
jgi:pSer/pThr/pTyr-binding forkhead associated (FHA) protein